jgi:hypothetical protein
MPDPIAVAAGVAASFMAASVVFATWEIRRAREAISSLYRLDRESELMSELDIEPNELRRFELWLAAEDGDELRAADVERYIQIAVAVDETLERSKATERARLKAAVASSGGHLDRKSLRRAFRQWLSSDVSVYRAIRALGRELSHPVS